MCDYNIQLTTHIFMKTITCRPCAKINLGLHVTSRRSDGYHNLETMFYPIPLCDELTISESSHSDAPAYTFSQQGASLDCPAEKNLVVKTLMLLKEELTIPPVDIILKKNIPSGAGLGGGSSDAAFAMRALNTLFQCGLTARQMEQRVATLGADCAFFIQGRPTLAQGIGNEFTPFHMDLSGLYIIVVKPDVFVSTRDAYAGITPCAPASPLTQVLSQPIELWRDTLFNDFEKSIFALHPEVGCIKEELYNMGAVYASMSGSGSSVFGLFKAPVDEASLAQKFKDCFVHSSSI